MDLSSFRAAASTVIGVPAEGIYAFIADMPRMGEISPECTGGVWEGESRAIGAMFVGSSTIGDRTWQRRLRVVVADPPREFAWENLGDPAVAVADDSLGAARWGYTFTPVDGGTRVDETWGLLDNPRLEAVGEEALRQLEARNLAGMQQTLAKLKELLET
jgi:hypothetical protein